MKYKDIRIRVDQETHTRLLTAAKKRGLRLSHFCLSTALAALDRIEQGRD